MLIAKIRKKGMEIKTIRKNNSMTERIRCMQVGEIVKVPSNRDSVKSIITRLKREGKMYKTTVSGMATGIIVERVG